MNRLLIFTATLLLVAGSAAAEDAEGCRDHPLFSRLPGYSISSCEQSEYEERNFNFGPVKNDPELGNVTATVPVAGAWYQIEYALDEGVTRKSPLQIMRNFQNAAKAAGGTVEGEWPGWCNAGLDQSIFQGGNNCANWSTTLKLVKGGRENWVLVHPGGEGESLVLYIMERESMKQEIVANELLEKMNKDGFVTLYINFETAKATISADSLPQLDQVAAMMKASPALKIEVAGHTDNVGDATANQKLSEARAQSVMAALGQRGVAAARMTAKGYGQSTPIADNRSEDGRAKNRRVELVKK